MKLLDIQLGHGSFLTMDSSHDINMEPIDRF